MNEALLVGRQVLMMFIYIAIGIICVRTKTLAQEAGRYFANFTVVVITSCVIIDCFQRPLEREALSRLGLALILSIIFHAISTAVALLLIRKREGERYRIERIGTMFSNCGYMAIPLIAVAVGEDGIFYSGAVISMFCISIWTYGIMILTGSREFNWKKAILNPAVISFGVGILFYLTGFTLPSILGAAVKGIVAMNTPAAMITTGIFLSNINIKSTFCDPHIYYVCFLRLVLIPLALLCIFKLLGVSNWLPGAAGVVIANIIANSCSSASATVQFPARYGMESSYGAQIIAVTTLFSVITVPLMCYLAYTWL